MQTKGDQKQVWHLQLKEIAAHTRANRNRIKGPHYCFVKDNKPGYKFTRLWPRVEIVFHPATFDDILILNNLIQCRRKKNKSTI